MILSSSSISTKNKSLTSIYLSFISWAEKQHKENELQSNSRINEYPHNDKSEDMKRAFKH